MYVRYCLQGWHHDGQVHFIGRRTYPTGWQRPVIFITYVLQEEFFGLAGNEAFESFNFRKSAMLNIKSF